MFDDVTICLVQPDDLTVNVALRKRTSQSASRSSTSRLAVDGKRDNNYFDGSCSHTHGTGNWWQVELGDIYDLRRVVITNREDCCCKLHNMT